MAKWAIVDGGSGQLSDIVDEADKFEIYEGADATSKWCEVPDDTTFEHYMVNGTVIHHNDVEDPKEDAQVTRELGYGPIGEQLDMQYKDSLDGGTRWKDPVSYTHLTLPTTPNV